MPYQLYKVGSGCKLVLINLEFGYFLEMPVVRDATGILCRANTSLSVTFCP